MRQDPDLEAVADACIAALAVIEDHGTPQMKTIMRVLLYIVGKEIARSATLEQMQDIGTLQRDG